MMSDPKGWNRALVVIAVLGVGAGFSLLPVGELLVAAVEGTRAAGAWGVLLFLLAFVGGAPLTLMAEGFMAASGLLFGFPGGLLPALLGATLSGLVNFALARTWLRSRVEARIRARGGLLAGMEDALGKDGRKVVFLLRLPPLSPFHVLSYLLGASNVAFRDAAPATLVGMVPQVTLFVWLGAQFSDPHDLLHPLGVLSGPRLVLVVLATVLPTVTLTWWVRGVLRRMQA